jgi:hypothetical protein
VWRDFNELVKSLIASTEPSVNIISTELNLELTGKPGQKYSIGSSDEEPENRQEIQSHR